MTPRRALLMRHLGLFAGAILVACGGPAALEATSSSNTPQAGASPLPWAPAAGAAGYRVWVRQSSGRTPRLGVVDTAHDQVVRDLPDGLASPDWSRLYTVESGAAGSPATLRVLDLRSGREISHTRLDGAFDLARLGAAAVPVGLSPSGRWLTLVDERRDQRPRTASALLVVDTTGQTSPRRVTLAGDFSFDGIADDGDQLYLLENLPESSQRAGGQYRVRHYVISRSWLDPTVVVEKGEPENASMSGLGLTRVNSLDGIWQLTLYAFGKSGPFVHALQLRGSAADCIDLPRDPNGDQANQLAWSLAMSRDGSRLFAVNGVTGDVAVMSVGPWPAPLRTGRVTPSATRPAADRWGVVDAEAKRLVQSGAVLSADGASLYAVGDHSLLAIGTADLALHAELLSGQTITGLATSPDGRWLFAAVQGGPVIEVDMQSGAQAGSLRSATDPMTVVHVDPA